MELLSYLFNMLSPDGTMIGQAFQATNKRGVSKILTSYHQVRDSGFGELILKPYLGKSISVNAKRFQPWINHDNHIDVAEIPLRSFSGGIPVAEIDYDDLDVLIPNSREFPFVAATLARLAILQLVETDPSDQYGLYLQAYNNENRLDFGNSGAPVLNMNKNVIGIATHKFSNDKNVYGAYGQIISWKFNLG